jgi:hypothetical protein
VLFFFITERAFFSFSDVENTCMTVIISIRREVWAYKTSLTPLLSYWMACTESGKWSVMCICFEFSIRF